MRTYLSRQLDIAGTKAKYDESVKKILSDKIILAWILKYTVSEFQAYSIEEIIPCIEVRPEISTIPVNPGEVKQGNPEAVIGIHTEDKVPNEGMIFFDIRFTAYTPEGKQIKLIINVEAQGDYHPGYDLVTRAIFYCARMLSAQLDTEFTAENYNGLKKVYSIWICMDTPQYAKNTITEYHITQNKMYGNFGGKVRYDLLSVVMICLGDFGKKGGSRLHQMLEVLLSSELSSKEKQRILNEEFDIPPTVEQRGELDVMCNLSSVIFDKGREEEKRVLIQKMREVGIEDDKIAEILNSRDVQASTEKNK